MPEFLSKVQLYKMHGRSPIWSIASSLLSFFELRESIKSSHNKFALHLYRNACMHAQSLPLCLTLWNLRTIAHQAPLSMGFSRREYWSELPCPPPGDLPDPGIEPTFLTTPSLADRLFASSTTGKPHISIYIGLYINIYSPMCRTYISYRPDALRGADNFVGPVLIYHLTLPLTGCQLHFSEMLSL